MLRRAETRLGWHPWRLDARDPDALGWHQWLLCGIASAALIHIGWRMALLPPVFAADRTRITWLIAALYLGTTLFAGLRSRWLGSIARELSGGRGERLPLETIRRLAGPQAESPALAELFAGLEERLKGPHDAGWFLSGLCVKLGLLGTVIGFVLMLSSLQSLTGFEPSQLQALIRDMALGMGASLFTTLVGLLASIGLSAQLLILDRSAERLIARLRWQAAEESRPPNPAPAPSAPGERP